VLNIVKLSVSFSYCYAECHYAECHYAECRGAHQKCCFSGATTFSITTLFITTKNLDTQHDDTQHNNTWKVSFMLTAIFTECRYAECRYGECRGTIFCIVTGCLRASLTISKGAFTLATKSVDVAMYCVLISNLDGRDVFFCFKQVLA
jgi:hypothetical protein